MKFPAIRAKIGIWVYYVASMRFSQIRDHVKDVDSELHRSKALRDLLQRSMTDNYKSIANYLRQQDERFFNALVLAVYDGDPQWHEVRLVFGEDEEYYDLGLLELSGNEKVFPVDGQHRVKGIKAAIQDNPELENESVPVIFIGHKTDDDGMKRSRRLFSTLNRYAKPVSLRDIIALDEDDAVAIVSRELIESHPLFADERILDQRTKAIPESNKTAFTTIITFYECNEELLHLFLTSREVKDSAGKKLKGESAKAKQYVRFRPSEEELEKFKRLCVSFWDALSKKISAVSQYLQTEPPSTELLRTRDGGHILFRPAALIPFVRAVIRLKKETKTEFNDILNRINGFPLLLSDNIWEGILWDSTTHQMIMNQQRLIELLLVCKYQRALLSEREKIELTSKYAKALRLTHEDAELRVEDV